MFVTWSDEKHAIGIPDIDAQHQELFLITNRLFEEQDHPDRRAGMVPLLKRLYAYTRYHFSTEEGMFNHYGYTGSDEHQKIHRSFTDRVKTYLEEIRGTTPVNFNEIIDFLVNWILFHIQGEDHGYAAWFRERGIEPTVDFKVAAGSTAPGEDMLALYAEKKLALEITSLDSQHKELVRILQQTNDLIHTSPQRQRLLLKSIIQRLLYYSQFHFSFEEELMSHQGWQGLARHRELHAGFVRRILLFAKEYQAGTGTLSQEIVGFLKDWTIEHILVEDRIFKTDTIK